MIIIAMPFYMKKLWQISERLSEKPYRKQQKYGMTENHIKYENCKHIYGHTHTHGI